MSETNVRIKIELADTAAQKALADFVKSSGAADKAIGGLNKTASNLGKGADESAKSFTALAQIVTGDLGGKGAASVGNLAGLMSGPLLASIGAVASAGFVLSKALDLTLLAERNDQIANSFDAIAASAGLAGESLKEGLLAATQGLADDDDVLRAANKSIIELGSNAERIPEIMEIARKTTALFGGELVQNFENLSQALASGNTRALRNIGLIIDADGAQRKYAESLGVTVGQLSDAGKKQAIQNVALEQAKEKFANVDESTTKATLALQRFKVASGQLVDTVASATKSSGFFASVFDYLGERASSIGILLKGTVGTEVEKLDFKMINATRSVSQYTDELALLEEKYKSASGLDKSLLSTAIVNTKARLSEASAEVTKLSAAIGKLQASTATPIVKETKTKAADPIDRDAVLKQRTDDAKAAATADLEVQRASADLELEIYRNKLANKQITDEEFAQINYQREQQAIADRAALEAEEFSAANERLKEKFGAQYELNASYQAQRDALADGFAAKAIKNDAEILKSQTKLRQEEDKLQAMKVRAVADTFGNLSSLMQTNSRELFAIGKAASLASASINTYEAITKTMASVPYPFNIPLAVAQGIAGAVQVANIASTNPSFEQGGIVPGNSFTGDRVQANVNSGELILNRSQQTKLFEMANSGGGNPEMLGLLRIIASRDENITVNIGGKTVVDTLRSEIAGGRRFE